MMDGIREDRVTDWFKINIPNICPPLTFQLIAGGRSNLTYAVTDSAHQRFVLRRPPISHVLESAHDMGREFKIISSLGPTDIPVPPALGLCQDKSINNADFYVMNFVDGSVYADSIDAGEIPFEKRRPLGFEIMDVLVRLHHINPDDIGLGELGRKTGYAERQVKRWIKQWENSKAENVPEIEEVGKWLQDNTPPQPDTTIVHGDFRLGNCLVNNYKIAAVLDWELCTLGDPRADVGWFLNWWTGPGEIEPGKGDQAPTAVGGFPSREELTEYYLGKSGRDLSQINYFRALSYWKLAIITQGVYQRYLKGAMGKTNQKKLSFFKKSFDGCAMAARAMMS